MSCAQNVLSEIRVVISKDVYQSLVFKIYIYIYLKTIELQAKFRGDE